MGDAIIISSSSSSSEFSLVVSFGLSKSSSLDVDEESLLSEISMLVTKNQSSSSAGTLPLFRP